MFEYEKNNWKVWNSSVDEHGWLWLNWGILWNVVLSTRTYKKLFISDTNWLKGVTNTDTCFNQDCRMWDNKISWALKGNVLY